MTDEALDVECNRVNAVIQRVTDEPSNGLADIQAKARLGLGRMVSFRHDDDPDLRLVACILREIIAMRGLA